jgi:hypothetical protein
MSHTFEDKHLEIYLKREPKMSISKHDEDLYQKFIAHSQKWDYMESGSLSGLLASKNKSLKPGQLFLYEEINYLSSKVQINYPKIGIYLNSYIADQALQIEFASYRRSWEYRTNFSSEFLQRTYDFWVSDIQTRINHLILWEDQLLIYGIWNELPNWKQLKTYYLKTYWYHRTIQENRDIFIDSILNYE